MKFPLFVNHMENNNNAFHKPNNQPDYLLLGAMWYARTIAMTLRKLSALTEMHFLENRDNTVYRMGLMRINYAAHVRTPVGIQ